METSLNMKLYRRRYLLMMDRAYSWAGWSHYSDQDLFASQFAQINNMSIHE